MIIVLLLTLFASLLSPFVESRVETLERAYRGYWREHMAIVDPTTGRVAATATGGPDRVGFPLYVCYQVDYPVIAHGHPYNLLYTPSPEDIETAIRCDVSQLRVAGWNRLTGRAELCVMQRNVDAVYWPFVSAADMYKDFWRHEGRGKWSYKALTDAWTRYWHRFADKYGYSFECVDKGYRI